MQKGKINREVVSLISLNGCRPLSIVVDSLWSSGLVVYTGLHIVLVMVWHFYVYLGAVGLGMMASQFAILQYDD